MKKSSSHSPKQILDTIIEQSWSSETSASQEAWNLRNPALGQCAVTACVRQDYLGGEIENCIVTLPDGTKDSHYYNVFDGIRDDRTAKQFPDGTVFGAGAPKTQDYDTTRDYVLSNKLTHDRYQLLSLRVKRGLAFAATIL